ncbi:MAG: AraC family transcriptional regulator ligand-binding domain-containing protein [bacterium]|nr:AraC family transcriptional regulator ligand-binding domain-containing protein [bacterium]
MKDWQGKGSPALIAQALWDFLLQSGIEESQLIRQVGSKLTGLTYNQKVPLQTELLLWDLAAAQDPEIGFKLAEQAEARMLGLLGYLMTAQDNLGNLFRCIARYHRLIHDEARLSLRNIGEHPALCHSFSELRSGPGPAASQFTLASLYIIACQETLQKPRLLALHFQGPAQPLGPAFERIFQGIDRLWDQEENRLIFAPGQWDLPLRGGQDSGLKAVLDEAAQKALAEIPPAEDWTAQVQRVINEALPLENLDQTLVARRLGMSPRSLQRKLGEQGLQFRQMVEQARQQWAQIHLAQAQLNITEIAFLLGFSETSAFTRAFKRWTGLSPRDFRLKTKA